MAAKKPRKSRAKRQAAGVPVPQTAAVANDHIRIIGDCQRQLALIEAAAAEELAAAKARWAEQAEPYEAEVRARTEGLQIWCEAHRAALTQEGKTKTVQFAAGTVSWRHRPPSVSLRDLEEIIARIRELRLFQFLRTRVEVDKEAMQREPEAAAQIDGVKIGSTGEDFIVTPIDVTVTTTPAITADIGGDA